MSGSNQNQKQRQQTQIKKDTSQVSSSPAADQNGPLQILKYGSKNNLSTWRDQLKVKAGKDFGLLSRLLDTNEYHVHNQPDHPSGADTWADRTEEEKESLIQTYKCDMKHWRKQEHAMKDNRPHMYSLMIGALSPESKERIEAAEDWDDIDSKMDPLRLWKRIYQTHSAGGDLSIPIFAKSKAEHAYLNTRQGPEESLTSYRKRFTDAVRAYKAAFEEEPEADRQAYQYMCGLDKARFAVFRAELENNAILGVKNIPKTVARMHAAAEAYKVVVHNKIVETNTVFHIKATTQQSSQSPQDNGQKKKKKGNKTHRGGSGSSPPDPCKYCGGDHWNSACQQKPAAAAAPASAPLPAPAPEAPKPIHFFRATTSAVGEILAMRSMDSEDQTGPTKIHLDSQASISLFKDSHLLENIRRAASPKTITGINSDGEPLHATQVGDFMDLATVYIHPKAAANILSFSDVKERAEITFDQDHNEFRVVSEGNNTYHFSGDSSGLYICTLDDDPKGTVLATVAENEAGLTERELTLARLAKEFIRMLGYPSPRSAVDMLNAGAIINSPITALDIHNAYKVYGPDVAALRGKTTAQATVPYHQPQLLPTIRRDQVLSVDIMFADKHAFLVGVTSPLGMITCTHLGKGVGGRAKASIRKALSDQITVYKSKQFRVTTLLSDGEGAIASLTSEIQGSGITVNPNGSGQHAVVVERNLRTIKERARSIISSLAFVIASSLLPYLVYYVVCRINLVPRRGGIAHVSPRESFLGIKADYTRDFKCSFGDYLECTVPTTDNSLQPRTQACIALCPTGTQGAMRCLCLSTGGIVTRTAFKVLPTPDYIIKLMNEKANKEGGITVDAVEAAFTEGSPDPRSTAGVFEPPLEALRAPQFGEPFVAPPEEPIIVEADLAQVDDDAIIIEQRADHLPEAPEPAPPDDPEIEIAAEEPPAPLEEAAAGGCRRTGPATQVCPPLPTPSDVERGVGAAQTPATRSRHHIQSVGEASDE